MYAQRRSHGVPAGVPLLQRACCCYVGSLGRRVPYEFVRVDLRKLGPFDQLAVEIVSTTVASHFLLFRQNIASQKNLNNRIIQGPQMGVKAFWR